MLISLIDIPGAAPREAAIMAGIIQTNISELTKFQVIIPENANAFLE